MAKQVLMWHHIKTCQGLQDCDNKFLEHISACSAARASTVFPYIALQEIINYNIIVTSRSKSEKHMHMFG